MASYATRGPSITITSPAGSKLGAYVRRFEEIEESGPPAWASDNETLRFVAGVQMIADGTPFWQMPAPVVREHIVVPALIERGMPPGPVPEWLDALIDDEVELLQRDAQEEASAEKARVAHLPSKRKGGHPRAKTWHLAVIYAAYLDVFRAVPGRTDNRSFEMVATRLGPGVDRHQVRRIVRSFKRRLGSASSRQCDLMLLSTLAVSDLMAEFDREASPKEHRVRNGTAVPRLFPRKDP